MSTCAGIMRASGKSYSELRVRAGYETTEDLQIIQDSLSDSPRRIYDTCDFQYTIDYWVDAVSSELSSR